jgi:hypothetical protein
MPPQKEWYPMSGDKVTIGGTEMTGARSFFTLLSVPAVVGAAIAIMLFSGTARASDGPITPVTIAESAPQPAETARMTDLVSDHIYRSLLAYQAQAERNDNPAISRSLIGNPKADTAWPGAVAPPGAGQRVSWLFSGLDDNEAAAPVPGNVPALTGGPDPDGGAPGQRSRKSALAPGTSPMTTGDKFNYFLRKSFMPPWPYALAILGGVTTQALDTKDKKHRENAGEFMVGSMEHAARSFAFRTTANFFEKFAYASLFRQDPRYHPSESQGFGSRLGYAVSRVFVTQSDHGDSQFNASFILGGLTTAGISNAWEQTKHQNAQDTFKRWGTHVGLTALTNVLHEFFRR